MFCFVSDDIIVITTFDSRPDFVERIRRTNVTIQLVHRIDIRISPSLYYKGMLTKLYAWKLVQYSKILYVDSDFVFMKDPSNVVALCGDAPLCACVDQMTGC